MKAKFEFYAAFKSRRPEVTEIVEIEFKDDASAKSINDTIDAEFEMWLHNHLATYWKELTNDE